jgi:hypothetical protein
MIGSFFPALAARDRVLKESGRRQHVPKWVSVNTFSLKKESVLKSIFLPKVAV